MDEEENKRIPDFTGKLEVAAWKHTTKDGKLFLSVKLKDSFLLFKNEPKEKKITEEF